MKQDMNVDRYAVLGNPVAHSRSPFIHALFAQQTGQAVAYERVLCPLDGFAASVRAFAAQGGRGCNVTVPFKFDAPALAAHVTERALLAGAANVLRLDAGGWWADNSDGVGLVRDIEAGAGVVLAGRRVLAHGALALDLMYGPAAEPFLAWAHDAGAVPRDGLGMLVEQAAESFLFWRGVRPPSTQVLQEMRRDGA